MPGPAKTLAGKKALIPARPAEQSTRAGAAPHPDLLPGCAEAKESPATLHAPLLTRIEQPAAAHDRLFFKEHQTEYFIVGRSSDVGWIY